MHRLVGLADVQRPCVRIGLDRDRADTERARGADDAAGNLATVGDQQRFDHGRLRRTGARKLAKPPPGRGWERGLRQSAPGIGKRAATGMRAVIVDGHTPVRPVQDSAIMPGSRWYAATR